MASKFHSLSHLSALQVVLKSQRLEAERIAKIEQKERARLAAEARIFQDATVNAVALAASPRTSIQKPLPLPLAKMRAVDEALALAESLSDGFTVEHLLDTDTDLSYKAAGIGQDVLHKLRKGEWAIQAQIDLHGSRSDEARIGLTTFINDCESQGLRCVRVIHGKGLGSIDKQPVLMGKVRSWLIQKNAVIAYVAAKPAQGGAGALLVLLRARRPAAN